MTSLGSDTIAEDLRRFLGADNVDTDERELRAASVDRFKKYTAVNDIFDGPFPAAIAYARSVSDVAAVLRYANENRVPVVARTGRTGTEGGLETTEANTIILDGSLMNDIVDIDPENMQATVQCGTPLQTLEDVLRARGLTTGHSPQSKPLAQYGGLVATRSIGQFSTLYGGIEDMVVGVEAVFPDGTVSTIKAVPRRAAGPDIRHIIIGNEGALCFVTSVTVKLFRYEPENNQFHGFRTGDIDTGLAMLREVVQAGFRPSVARVYSEEDAAQHFSHFAQGQCVVVFVAEGPRGIVDATSDEIRRVAGEFGAEHVDPALIADWFENLNWGPDKVEAEKESMRDNQQLGYTTEVSADWSDVAGLYYSAMRRIREEFPRAADLTMLGAHSSHSYQTGTNLYFVYDYHVNCSPREEISTYHQPINAIIVDEALAVGGSMVHHHGIGKYRAEWTSREHGTAYPLLRALKETFDPHCIMNPGTIYPRLP